MKKCSIERGVHTLELYLGQLSYAEVDAMIEDLYDMAKKQKTPELIRQREKHPSPLKRSYEVHGLLPDGIILQIYQQFFLTGNQTAGRWKMVHQQTDS